MRSKSLILIIIALACGLVASIGISQVMKNRIAENGQDSPMEQIYVASADIPLGHLLDAKMVKVEEWPRDKMPAGAIQKLEDVEGKRPITRLYAGEPLLSAKVVDADKFSGAAEKIPKGLRVASVLVTMDSSASGLINPGDRVDVLVFLKEGPGVTTTGTRTILKNVTVFAVNDRFKREIDDEGEGLSAKTVSLLVKPTQVEKIMLASELGKIKLSLRSSEDQTQDNAGGATIADLGSSTSQESSTTTPVAATRGGIGANFDRMQLTDMLQNPLDASANRQQLAAKDDAKKSFVMRILTPRDIQVYNWDQLDSLPRELLYGSDAGQTGEPQNTGGMTPRVEPIEDPLGLEPDLDTSEKADTNDDLTSTETDNPLSN